MTTPLPLVAILNGPNMNMLGLRQPQIYGAETLDDIEALCAETAEALDLAIDFRQSNHEGELISWIQECRDTAAGIVINPAGYSHTSIALMDALLACELPVIEVHVTNIHRRETFRHHSYVSSLASGLLAALARPGRVAAFVGVAAAPDFTETLIWETLMPAERATLQRDGVLHVPSQYGEPTPITLALIEEGRRHRLLGAPIPLACPVRLLHGQADADVPWETSLRLAERITGEDVQVTLVKDGAHRMSRPADLALLMAMLSPLLGAP